MTAILGWLVVVPDIRIAATTPLTEAEVLTTPFVVSNEGFLPLWQVRSYCHFVELRDASGRPRLSNVGIFLADRINAEKLTRGESFSKVCGDQEVVGELDYAKLVFVARAYLLPPSIVGAATLEDSLFEIQISQGFETRRDSQGKARWLAWDAG